jgi:histidinol dehydrogenase
MEFAADWAPEHLLLAVDDPGALLPSVRNAGTVFLGASASVVFGDYLTGANHVLPTGGTARAYSGLSTLDFMRWTTYQRIDRAAAGRLADDAGALAEAEGLPAHAAAARAWRAERRDV